MKSVITAMGNSTLNDELKRYTEFDVICDDLFYQEAVTDLLENITADVLTLSGILQGQWDLFEFIDRIQKVYSSRIIIIMDELDSDTKCKLLERGIQDIFLDDNVEVSDIVEAINREEPLIKKLENSKSVVREIIADDYDANYAGEKDKVVQKQEIIAISGISGSGKSTFCYNFSKILSKKSNSSVLVVDMDTLSGNIEELFNINKVPVNIEIQMDDDKRCGLNYAADLIKKNRFDMNVLDEIVIRLGNVDILTGNTSLYYCQEVLNEKCYEQILSAAKEKYDFIIFDTSSNIFLDSTRWCLEKASKVLFLTENNYLSIKKAEQMLNIATKTWGIWKEKINLIINKEKENGVQHEVIEKIMNDYKIVGRIKQNLENEPKSYNSILEKINYIPKTKLKDKIIFAKGSLIDVIQKTKIRTFSNGKECAEDVN